MVAREKDVYLRGSKFAVDGGDDGGIVLELGYLTTTPASAGWSGRESNRRRGAFTRPEETKVLWYSRYKYLYLLFSRYPWELRHEERNDYNSLERVSMVFPWKARDHRAQRVLSYGAGRYIADLWPTHVFHTFPHPGAFHCKLCAEKSINNITN